MAQDTSLDAHLYDSGAHRQACSRRVLLRTQQLSDRLRNPTFEYEPQQRRVQPHQQVL